MPQTPAEALIGQEILTAEGFLHLSELLIHLLISNLSYLWILILTTVVVHHEIPDRLPTLSLYQQPGHLNGKRAIPASIPGDDDLKLLNHMYFRECDQPLMYCPRIYRLEDLHSQCLRRVEAIVPLLAQDAQRDKRAIFIVVELVEAMPGIQVGKVHCHEKCREVALVRQDDQLLQVMPNLKNIIFSVDPLNRNL